MGYYYKFTGELVTYTEITEEDAKFIDKVSDGWFLVKNNVIVPNEELQKFYDQDLMIDKICAYFKNLGIVVEGMIQRSGENSLDLAMMVVRDNVRKTYLLPQIIFNTEKLKWEFKQ